MSTVAISTPSAPASARRSALWKSLFVQVLAALLLGILLGVATPHFAVDLKILSDAFLKLISMIVAPIVFCVVVHGIAGAGDLKKVGRVGVKALVYFEVMTTAALILGIVLAFLFGVGRGMNIDTSTLDPNALHTHAENAHNLQGAGMGSFILNIIPTTSIDALARNDVLQVLFFAVIFVIVVLGLVMRLAGISIFKFLAYMREELTIVLATASSDAVLPQIMRKLERMGAKKSVVGLVVPTGYSFNLDAFSIYLTLAVVF